GNGRTADSDHGIDVPTEAGVAQGDEASHRGSDADNLTVTYPRHADYRVEVVHLALTEGGEASARAVAAEVGRVDGEACLAEAAGQVDHLRVALRAGEAVAEHDREVGVGRAVPERAEEHAVGGGDGQRLGGRGRVERRGCVGRRDAPGRTSRGAPRRVGPEGRVRRGPALS